MPLKPEHQATVDKYISKDHNGNKISAGAQKAMLQPNPMVSRILAARAATLSDDERAALKSAMTPASVPALKKLLPELANLMDRGMNNAG